MFHINPFTSLACALILCISLISCESEDTSITEIRVIGENVPPLIALDQVSKKYFEESGVNIVVEAYDFETAIQRATLDIVTGEGSYDVILLPHLSLGRFVENEYLTPITELNDRAIEAEFGFDPETDLFPQFWRELSWYNGDKYGYPFTANTMYLAYRKDWFEDPIVRNRFRAEFGYELGVPVTWSQFYDIASFFTNPSASIYGFALQGKRHPAVWYEWLNFAYGFGGGVLDAESSSSYGDIIVNCPETVEGTAFYKSLLAYAPPDTLQYTWDEHLAAMQSGNIAMAIMWSDTIPSLEDQSSSAIAGRVGYASLPALSGSEPKTQIAGWSYLISNSSNQKEEALRFVIWMMGAEQQIAQQLLGGASALKETYNNSEVLKIPYTSGYISAIEDAVTMSSSFPEMEAISNELQICISDYLSGDESAKSALDRCALRINEVLRARGDVVLQCPVTSRN